MDESDNIFCDNDDKDEPYYPNYLKVENFVLRKMLKIIVQLPVVDLGARFPDREIPCYCPFHKKSRYS